MKPFFDMSMLAAVGYLAIFMLLGVLLRHKIKLFQQWLLPASLIGGMVGMVFANTTGFYGAESANFKAISYHTFALTFISISMHAINYYVIPVVLLSVVATVATFFVCIWLGRRTEGAALERSLFLYGTATGTTATGLLLLRLVDDEYKTTIPIEIAISNLPCIGGGILMGILVQGVVVFGWTFWMTFAGFLAYGAACFLGLLVFRLISKEKAF